MMRPILILALICCPACWGGYAYKATVNFSGATTSTQTNITLLFTFSDAKLKTVANSGQIQNTCMRNGSSVPCDLVFTNDASCGSLTGSYTWGFDGDYSATAGTGHGWIMIPSYTTSGVTPTVCVGNAAVSTYQGGSAGAEFDASTKAAYHLSDGTTLSVADFSATAATATNHGATATAGKVDGAGAFVSGSSQYIDIGAGAAKVTGAMTVEAWVKTTVSVTSGFVRVVSDLTGSNYNGFELIREPSGTLELQVGNSNTLRTANSSAIAINTVYHVAGVYDGVDIGTVYLNGAAGTPASGWGASAIGTSSQNVNIGRWPGASGNGWDGFIDEVRISNVARSPSWIATEYANQNSPPAIGAFTALGYVANQSVISIQ